MRKMRFAIGAIVVFCLQSSVLPFIFNGITQPNLIFVFVTLIALHMGHKIGMATALAGGFCQDVIIGTFFGIHMLPYLIIAFVCGSFGENVDREQWLLPFFVVLIATEFCLIITCGVLWLSDQYVRVFSYLFQYSVPMLVYHAVLAIPLDRIVWMMKRDDPYSFIGYR